MGIKIRTLLEVIFAIIVLRALSVCTGPPPTPQNTLSALEALVLILALGILLRVLFFPPPKWEDPQRIKNTIKDKADG